MGNYHLIVADDEPIIADALGELLQQVFADADVRVAYSAHQVLQIVNERPVDILVSDIQMPGMTGLELVDALRGSGMAFSVLFLTGYDDFNYAYEAFRQNANHYLLKTEGDEAVIRAVGGVIEQLNARRFMAGRIQEVEQRFEQLVPAYRRELLTEQLDGGNTRPSGEQDEFEDDMIFIVAARCARRGDPVPRKKKLIALEAVREILIGTLNEQARWMEALLLDEDMLWLVGAQRDQNFVGTLFQLMRKARHQLEEKLDLGMFFVVSDAGLPLAELGGRWEQLRAILSRETERGMTGAAIGRQEVPYAPPSLDETQVRRINALRRQLDLCAKALRDGALAQFKAQLVPLIAFLSEVDERNPYAVEFESALTSLIYGLINREGLFSLLGEVRDEQLGAGRIAALADSLARASEEKADNAMRSIVNYVLAYIHDHLAEDLSAQALSEATGYSIGYLTRVFKQQQGISIHEYVTMSRMNLAKELLANTKLRVYEIASSCGYDNTTYFIRLFKAHNDMTPQEFKHNAAMRSGQKGK